VSSDIASIDPDAYLSAIKLRSGIVYSPTLVENEITRLERLAVQNSENFVRVEPRITRNDRDLTLDIDFNLSRGPRVFVERIDIEGNTTTLDRVVRREFPVVEGDPFNPREVRAAAERIRALGFFEEAAVDSRQGSAPDQVIVDVDVTEQPTGSVGFGASYSTGSGFGFAVNFNERNFLGRGQALSADLNATESSASFGFNFLEPALLGRDVGFGLSLAWRETDNDNSFYSTRRGVISPSLRFPLDESTSVTVRGSLLYEEVYGIDRGFPEDSSDPFDTGSSAILRAEEDLGGLLAFELGYALAYDSRAIGLDPTFGLQVRVTQDIGFREDDASYVRSEILVRARKSILNEDVTLRAEFEAGGIAFEGGNSRVTERYTLAGKMRGFQYNGIGPRDLNVSNEDALGGNVFAVARFEADFPLGLPEEYGISGGVFYDIGSVWGLDNIQGGPTGNDPVDDDFSLRSAAGVSIFWDTAFGPLRFNFSRPILKESYDEEQNFEFTVSTRF
jgi:outer membrane protein insertion porin family